VNGVLVGMILCPIQVSDGDDEGVSKTESQQSQGRLKVRMTNRPS
jgi:hypothetical protein